ncbi:hypothetical protein HMPREF0653_01144 [Prevotella disiens JCM 6334 = ATCC 29426]|uniref:Uncharacterized protein n=1 Tax=Prevotella disiens JCM 6334 = ATCC 29426 TaxID=1235811 RepID=A0ABN0NSK0_9BACT|nr:hypothetical protein HMPREF0653_01144 [Prevotella disiens JCM 6334 = ATCC 29426]
MTMARRINELKAVNWAYENKVAKQPMKSKNSFLKFIYTFLRIYK